MVMRGNLYGVDFGLPIQAVEFQMEEKGHWVNGGFATIAEGKLILQMGGVYDLKETRLCKKRRFEGSEAVRMKSTGCVNRAEYRG